MMLGSAKSVQVNTANDEVRSRDRRYQLIAPVIPGTPTAEVSAAWS